MHPSRRQSRHLSCWLPPRRAAGRRPPRGYAPMSVESSRPVAGRARTRARARRPPPPVRDLRNGGELRSRAPSIVVDVLDRDATVAVRQPPIGGKLGDDFGRGDQACPAKQHLEWDDRRVKPDREVLLEAAHREAAAQEFGHAPMGKKRNLENAIGEAELARAGAEALFDARSAVREGDQPDLQSRRA